ncbi:MAG: substrate-binding domain-containing protein, partial [Methyloprofundus sp.]|nr:substrate-binding domain-containing protein [Methyloprofundus sp.]
MAYFNPKSIFSKCEFGLIEPLAKSGLHWLQINKMEMTITLEFYKSASLLKHISIFCTVLILLLSSPVMGATEKSHEQKPLKIALFYSNSTSGFWSMVEAFGSATAEDLNIQFDSYRFGGSPSHLVSVFNKVLNDPVTRPDGFLFYNYNHRAELILKEAEKAGVPALMFNAGPGEQDGFGSPRERYRQFIGQITPDDVTAGYDLAIELIKQGRKLNLYDENNKLQLVAFEGLRASIPARQRLKGLHKALRDNDDVVLKQQFRTKWERKRTEDAFLLAVKRYPQATLFWAASDSMALGVL